MFQWDAVDSSPDLGGENVLQTVKVVDIKTRTTWTELGRVFCMLGTRMGYTNTEEHSEMPFLWGGEWRQTCVNPKKPKNHNRSGSRSPTRTLEGALLTAVWRVPAHRKAKCLLHSMLRRVQSFVRYGIVLQRAEASTRKQIGVDRGPWSDSDRSRYHTC